MSPDPPCPSLLRSPLLWCGLVVMVFLGWAWRDSVGRWCYLRTGPLGGQSMASGVMLWHAPEERGGWGYGAEAAPALRMFPRSFTRSAEMLKLRLGRPGFGVTLTPEDTLAFRATGELDGRKPDAALALIYFEGGNGGSRFAFIPYWCMMLVVLGMWLGLIYWRYRRWRRNLTGEKFDI